MGEEDFDFDSFLRKFLFLHINLPTPLSFTTQAYALRRRCSSCAC